MHQILRIRLRAKLMAGVSLVLLPLLGLLLYGIEENYEMRRTSLLNNMRQTANTSGLLVEASLQEARRLAQTLAAESANQGLDPDELKGFIERLSHERTEMINLTVFDPAGRPVATALPWREGLDISDRAYFQQAIQTKEPVVSELIIGRAVERPAVVAAAPVLHTDGQVLGVVTVSLRLDLLARRMLDIGLRPGQAIFVADPRGRLVFYTSRLEAAWEERDLSGLPELQEALAGNPVLTTEPLREGLAPGGACEHARARRARRVVPHPALAPGHRRRAGRADGCLQRHGGRAEGGAGAARDVHLLRRP